MKSQFFSGLAIRAFNRVGDIVIPKDGDFPSFSEYGGAEHLDKSAAYAPPADIRMLNILMSILSMAPSFFFRWLVKKAASSHQSTGPLTPLFRKLYFGWWGLLFSCYYSNRPGSGFEGKDPVDIIQFRLNRAVD